MLRQLFPKNGSVARYSTSFASLRRKRRTPKPQPEDKELRQESLLLDQRLKEIKEKTKSLRQVINKNREAERAEWLSRADGARLIGGVSENQVKAVEASINADLKAQLIPPAQQKHRKQIPESVKALVLKENPSTSLLAIDASDEPYLPVLQSELVFDESIPQTDVELFVAKIPLNRKAEYIKRLQQLIPEKLRSQFVKDNFMAAYAARGEPELVERTFNTCITPTVFSYGHLAKSRFKVGMPPETVFAVLSKMEKQGIDANIQIYTTAIQSLVQHNRFAEAEGVFNKMKYMSSQLQPDTKLYNTIILAAARFNVNRALDLYEEMQTRPVPVLPDSGTYNILVYACARDPKTHLTAWNLFNEAFNRGFSLNKESFRALMYLCGNAGELVLARGLVKRLLETNAGYVDNFMLNCLFLAYNNWDKNAQSQVLSSSIGTDIRKFLVTDHFDQPTLSIPLLPVSEMREDLVLPECMAVFQHFEESNPQLLFISNTAAGPKYQRSTIFVNLLRTAIKFGDSIDDFVTLYTKYTTPEGAGVLDTLNPDKLEGKVAERPNFVVGRTHYTQLLAMDAAIKFKDLKFGEKIWNERGTWRKQTGFQSLPAEEQQNLDFKFAQKIISLFAAVGDVEQAIAVLESASGLHKWEPYDIPTLIDLCHRLEDFNSVDKISSILRNRH